MLDYKFLEPFEQEEFSFNGAYCYYKNDKCFLLSGIGTSIILDTTLLKQLEDKYVSEDLAFKLYQRGFANVYDKPRRADDVCKIRPTLFMIDFTTKCNCNCIYCLRHFENVGESINIAQLDKTTDYIINYCKKHNVGNIAFQPWGGEPLIELEKILHCKNRFEAAGIQAKFNVQTNGLLLTLENYKKLRENDIDIGVSIDGLAEVHDFHRLDVRGNKTHQRIVSNLKEILNAYPDCNIGTLSVNSSYSIDKISDNIDYIVNGIGISNIKFNLVHPSGSCEFDEGILIKKEQIPEYVENIINGVVRQIEKGNRCHEANVADKLSNLLVRPQSNICNSMGCRGGISFISFDRGGNIYPCEMIGRDEMKLGNIDENIDLVELIAKTHESNPYYASRKTEKCEGCPFYYFCRGGCKACSLAYKNKAEDVDFTECEINKVMYPMLIELILDRPKLAEQIIDNRIKLG